MKYLAPIISVAALFVALFGNVTIYQAVKNNKETLCTFRKDLALRYQVGVQFLEDHPNGLPGLASREDLVNNLNNQRATLNSLSGLDCGNDVLGIGQ